MSPAAPYDTSSGGPDATMVGAMVVPPPADEPRSMGTLPCATPGAGDVADGLLDRAPTLDVTVVVPFRNVGAARLRAHLDQLCAVLAAAGVSFEVVAVSDGSTDGSEQAAVDAGRPQVRSVVLDGHHGKGEALRRGLAGGSGRFLGFIDGDGDIPATALADLLTVARAEEPAIVVGSKCHPASELSTPVLRRLASAAHRLLSAALLSPPVPDTQTGVKLVRRDVLADVLPATVERRYGFDLELLVLADRRGHGPVAEVPVTVAHRGPSTIGVAEAAGLLRDTVAIWWRLRRPPASAPRSGG